MNRHTEGVWVVDRRDDNRIYVAQQYGDGPGGRICEVFSNCLVTDEGCEANAKLIAAAPDLLAALRDIIGWVPGPSNWHTNAAQKAVERAIAAMEKATGEVQ